VLGGENKEYASRSTVSGRKEDGVRDNSETQEGRGRDNSETDPFHLVPLFIIFK
jgi:hypothetical protein